jgi:hypothetical protein
VIEEFFRSVARSFAENRKATAVVEAAILVLVALVLALQLAAAVRRWWRRRTRLHALAAAHGVDPEDLAFAAGLARLESVAPLALLTRVELFERATARALAAAPGHPEAPHRIHRLRRAMGFDRLPAHTPLLTSRELAPGVAIEVGPDAGQVSEVREEALVIRLRADAPRPVAGQELELGLIHAREARYELRCRVIEAQTGEQDELVLSLAHDEAPRRIQQRDYARVATRGAMALHPVPPWPLHAGPLVDVVARLEDISAGGALVMSRALLPVGLLAEATFTLGRDRFERLPVVVLSAEPLPGGSSRARLEWGRLSVAMRDRLVAAVAHLELLGLG